MEMLRNLKINATRLLADNREATDSQEATGNQEGTTSLLDRFTKSLRAANARKSRKETTLHAYFGPK